MRITFCHNETEYLCDAQSIFLQRLMTALKARGHEPRLLLISPRDPARCALFAFCRTNEIPFAATHSLGSTSNNIRWCVSRLESDPPDVFVPNHCAWALYASRWAMVAGMPSVCVLHSDDEPVRSLIRTFGRSASPFRQTAFVAVSRAIRGVVDSMRSTVPTYIHSLWCPACVGGSSHRPASSRCAISVAWCRSRSESRRPPRRCAPLQNARPVLSATSGEAVRTRTS